MRLQGSHCLIDSFAGFLRPSVAVSFRHFRKRIQTERWCLASLCNVWPRLGGGGDFGGGGGADGKLGVAKLAALGGPLLHHPTVVGPAAAHQATPAQVLLAWARQHSVAVIPKSRSVRHR